MIFLKRRRLIIWLFKAYLKKWRKTIFLSFLAGLFVFFVLLFGINYFIPLLPFTQNETIGLTGAYTADNLPSAIVSKLSSGLTKVGADQQIKPNIAKSWEIKNGGKTYIFNLRNDIYFSDGKLLTSEDINYNFIDANVKKPNKETIVFELKHKYSPFLVTVSKPIFKKGYIGVGEYKVKKINLNGSFIQSVSIIAKKLNNKEITYQFYPTEEALKTAFMLGEISQMNGLKSLNFKGLNMSDFPNVTSKKQLDYMQLVTIFYNTNDRNLSDKRLRNALSYAIPDKFDNGQRNYGPFNPVSWVAKNGLTTYSQDIEHAKILLKDSSASEGAKLTIELKTLPQYEDIAKKLKIEWEKLDIKIKINVVQSLPLDFQAFLGDFNVPKDPDQYMLWHSSQESNITSYKNLRIDKLLEDGRQTYDINERIKIYDDFQKYLLDDPPATFLYFPFVYEVKRK